MLDLHGRFVSQGGITRPGARGVNERDVSFAQMACQHSTQVMQSRFASAVCKRLQGRNTQPVDAPNVDNSGRVARAGTLLQQRRQELCDEEEAMEVQRQDSGPGGRGVFIVGSAPVGTRIVD